MSVAVVKAMENMPACSAPASCVATMDKTGKSAPHAARPAVLST